MTWDHRNGQGDPNQTSAHDCPRSLEILVVIVNYKTATLAVDCLRSLESEIASFRDGRARVVVTDNASPDDSVGRLQVAVLKNGWSQWAEVQPLEHNGGFAYGNNAAIRPALASENPPGYVWLLNPDTVVRPGALEALIDFMEANPRVGIAGSRMEGPDGELQRSAFRFPSILSEVEDGFRFGLVSRLLSRWIVAPPIPAETSPCDWVAGASMIIRRAVFDAVGLMSEAYFMYYEEVDFCRRASRAGWPCWYVTSSHVIHLEGQSSGMTGKEGNRKRRPAYWFQARRRYFVSNLGKIPARVADVAWVSSYLTYRLRRVLQRKPDTDPPHFLSDFVRQTFFTPASVSPLHGQSSPVSLPAESRPPSA